VNQALIAFIIETVLPYVLRNLPAILRFISTINPQAHEQIVTTVKRVSKDQGPEFDWHSGP
jgi:hypothetical protein